MYRLQAKDITAEYIKESYHKDVREAVYEYNRMQDLTDCELELYFIAGEDEKLIRSNNPDGGCDVES